MPTREGEYLSRRAIEEARKAQSFIQNGDHAREAAVHDALAIRYLQLAHLLSRFG